MVFISGSFLDLLAYIKTFFFPLDRDSHRHVVMIVVAWALIKIMGVRMCLPENVIPRNIRTYIIHFI